MKYPVLAVAIAAAGWGFVVVPPSAFAATDGAHHDATIESSHDKGGVHLDHGDHIDPEPEEINETILSYSYTLPFPHPYPVFVTLGIKFISGFRDVPNQG